MSRAYFLSLKPLLLPSSLPPVSLPSTPTNYQLNPKTHRTIPKIPFSSFRYDSETECPVPPDQQPINEYQALSNSFPFSWASGDVAGYSARLFVTGACFALFVGLPVSWVGSVGPKAEPIILVLAAASSGLFVVILAVVRMYLGWAYVGNRLLSATVEYEETGWYDGQIWVKSAQVLARDRLLGSFSVKPVLARLKNTLVALGTSLLMCISILVNYEATHNNGYISTSSEPGGRAVPGIYKDESARNFEPDAFCGDSN